MALLASRLSSPKVPKSSKLIEGAAPAGPRMMRSFDLKFGKTKFESLPARPGIYRYFDAKGALIYVGKAKNLRRRLGQYRNARRCKHHRKMRCILADAAKLEFEICASDLDALLLETNLIQTHRPRWNVAGAFSFLYPFMGVKRDVTGTYLCIVSNPEDAPGYSLHGAFRSRSMAEDTFNALTDLLCRVAHPLPTRRLGRFGKCEGFRGLPLEWVDELERFFRGESRTAMESLVLSLIEAPHRGRNEPKKIQRSLDALRWFWKHEALPLKAAREKCQITSYPVLQTERDPLFIRYRHLKVSSKSPSKEHTGKPRREANV